jgi:hypothetical protein
MLKLLVLGFAGRVVTRETFQSRNSLASTVRAVHQPHKPRFEQRKLVFVFSDQKRHLARGVGVGRENRESGAAEADS